MQRVSVVDHLQALEYFKQILPSIETVRHGVKDKRKCYLNNNKICINPVVWQL
jgi:hypothetical protein